MVTRRAIGASVLVALAGCTRFGGRTDGGDVATPAAGATVNIDAPAFADGTAIPRRYTCEGENTSPELDVVGLPAPATTYAVVVDDPDAGAEPFVHWLLWNVPATALSLPSAIPQTPQVDSLDGAVQGTNSAGVLGYTGPCPPRGDGPHTYRFIVSAVEGSLDVAPGAKRPAVEAALAERVIAQSALTGTFTRA